MKERIPEDYFDSLADKLLNKINVMEDDLAKVAPTLASLDKSEPYSVPNNYFELLTDNICGSVKPKERKLMRFFSYGLVAASLLLVMYTFVLKNTIVAPQNDYNLMAEYYSEENKYEEAYSILSDGLDNIPEEELDLYMEVILDDFSDEELSALF